MPALTAPLPPESGLWAIISASAARCVSGGGERAGYVYPRETVRNCAATHLTVAGEMFGDAGAQITCISSRGPLTTLLINTSGFNWLARLLWASLS
jgi:hypothetical protein